MRKKHLTGSLLRTKKLFWSAFKGALVVLEFWAGWCDPCMAQAEHMVKLHKEFGPKGVSFVGVNLDRNTTPPMLHPLPTPASDIGPMAAAA
jgi:thiol-disulfide isomerase/thioredoxin